MIGKTLPLLALIAVAGTSAFAGSKDGITFRNDGQEIVGQGSILSYTPVDLADPGLVKIFDNLATKDPKGVYWASLGATVSGPNAAQGFEELWPASAFTPTGDHTVTKIEIAVSAITGTNEVVVSLNADANGLPGAPIETWHLKNLPHFLSCCVLLAASDKKGIQVSGGTQYWIVISTDSSDANFWGGADLNVTDEIDPAVTASYCSDDVGGTCTNANDAWTLQTGKLPAFAFAVLGSN
ncbi:MAG TPA: choice-of-anchor R domain-containing protein [Rhizomicrobium sp.]|jgi:hypothetical protein